MKPHTLPVKRRPVPKGILKRLSAVTGNHRKQRVAATAGADMEMEDGSTKISRALTIIFLIHIVAIGLIFVHNKFLDGRAPEEPKTAKAATQEAIPTVTTAPPRSDLPRLSKEDTPYIVRPGDNYTRIAAAAGVDENDLRVLNRQVEIGPGTILKLPPQRAIVVPQELASNNDIEPAKNDKGLVPAVDVSDVPKAKLVKPNVQRSAQAAATPAPVASGKSYVVQSGDSVWRIAHRYNVSQEALMKANGISDARKIKVGMSLSIPR